MPIQDDIHKAFLDRNAQLSRQAHKKKFDDDITVKAKSNSNSSQINNTINNNHQEHHNGSGSYLKSAVYGGLDGIITTYSVVMGVAGANLSLFVVLALGIANLIGDGISMALGDYLSSKSEQEFQDKERRREEWEVENNPEEEKQEMVALYVQKGISLQDATQIVDILAKYKTAWIDVMMVEELGLLPVEGSPVKNALVTFVAFATFGSIPLVPFIIQAGLNQFEISLEGSTQFSASAMLSALALFALGYFKAAFTFANPYVSGAETLVIGIAAALASYFIGSFFR